MANINLLKGKIVAAGYTMKSFAEKVGIPAATFSRRLHKKIFMSDEIEKIVEALDLSPQEIKDIFFN